MHISWWTPFGAVACHRCAQSHTRRQRFNPRKCKMNDAKEEKDTTTTVTDPDTTCDSEEKDKKEETISDVCVCVSVCRIEKLLVQLTTLLFVGMHDLFFSFSSRRICWVSLPALRGERQRLMSNDSKCLRLSTR